MTATTTVGHFTGRELRSNDLDAAVAFYTELFGWQATPTPNGFALTNRGADLGGVSAAVEGVGAH